MEQMLKTYREMNHSTSLPFLPSRNQNSINHESNKHDKSNDPIDQIEERTDEIVNQVREVVVRASDHHLNRKRKQALQSSYIISGGKIHHNKTTSSK